MLPQLRNLLNGYINLTTSMKVIATLASIILYMVLDPLVLPEARLVSSLPLQIRTSFVLVPIVSVMLGSIYGFTVGFVGSLLSDILYNKAIIAFGTTNLAIGLIGLIVGVPSFDRWRSLMEEGAMVRFLLFSVLGIIVSSALYVWGLVYLSKQNLMMTILYNLLPFIGQQIASVLLFSPTILAPLSYSVKRSLLTKNR